VILLRPHSLPPAPVSVGRGGIGNTGNSDRLTPTQSTASRRLLRGWSRGLESTGKNDESTLNRRYDPCIMQWVPAATSAALCTAAAACLTPLFHASSFRPFLPLLFLGVIVLVAIRFGRLAGMLGTVAAALIFAEFLFEPRLVSRDRWHQPTQGLILCRRGSLSGQSQSPQARRRSDCFDGRTRAKLVRMFWLETVPRCVKNNNSIMLTSCRAASKLISRQRTLMCPFAKVRLPAMW